MSKRKPTENEDTGVLRNVSLEKFNTLGLPSEAERLAVVRSVEDLRRLHEAGELDHEPWVLGGGSNVLLLDRVGGIVLKNEIRFTRSEMRGERELLLEAGGGNDWHELVTHAVENDWGGIENLALIPGTVGAAPIQNIGAYGVELSDCFESLEAFDLKEGRQKRFEASECRFGYRDSIFKNEQRGRYMITSVTLRLTLPPHTIRRSYRTLDLLLEERGIERPTIRDIFDAVVSIRRGKLPDPSLLGNAGSFFKNPIVTPRTIDRLREQEGEVPCFRVEGGVKVPAGWLIEKAGWKGRRIGNVGVYENQALVLVNHGSADGREMLELAERVRESVRRRFGIELVPEVQVTGTPDRTS